MKILGIIPARYASTRFPAKPLVDIAGKSMIQRVYEQAKKSNSLSEVIVATDHLEIYNHMRDFGNVCLTREDHISGTDRCYEVLTQQKTVFDYVINIQGDEPFIKPEQIDLLASMLTGEVELGTLVKKINSISDIVNPNLVKVVISKSRDALYFSRSPIPYIRNTPEQEWINNHTFYKHIGMYAYRSDILEEITKLHPSSLEKAESLEQLRWLENGFKIRVAETEFETIGIDTPEDLEKALAHITQ